MPTFGYSPDMPYYLIQTNLGLAVNEAKNLRQARKVARQEEGTAHLIAVTPATRRQLEWVRAMGGWLPQGALPDASGA